MVTIPLPAFEPDKNIFNGTALPEIINALPVSDGWGPMPSAVTMTPATFEYLTDENGNPLTNEDGTVWSMDIDGGAFSGLFTLDTAPRGGIFARTDLGTTRLFEGTISKIFSYNFADYTWVDVTPADTSYSVPVGNRWSMTRYGNDTVYAQNGNDPEQFIDIATGTAFEENETAPVATYIAAVGDFLVRARLETNPSALQWSALNDPTSNVGGVDFSDEQVLPTGGGITGILPMSFGAVVFCHDALYAMNLVWGQFTFSFSPITNYRGAIAPYSICQIGQDDFVFFAADGFFRGLNMQPIGAERVNRWFMSQTSESDRSQISAAPDYANATVWWTYKTPQRAYKMLGYNWLLDRFLVSDEALMDILAAETPGITIDGLDALYSTLDDVDEPIDSSAFDGGTQVIAGVTSDGMLAFINGPPMQATIETNQIAHNGTSRAFVNGGRLFSDAANYTVAVSTTDYKGGPSRDRAPVSPTTRTRNLSLRADGRTHQYRTIIPAGETWSTVSALDVDVTGSGKS